MKKIALGLAFVGLSLVLFTGCAEHAKQESAGQYVDSSGITAQVKANLLADKRVKSLPITVNTYKDHVQLSGFVESRRQVEIAGSIAAHVPGVKSVQNDLVVR